jgi:hypothetical protein
MGMAITEQDRAAAFELFDQGESTNAVATKLFKCYWVPAKKLRDEWVAAGRGVETAPRKPRDKKKSAVQQEAAEPEDWDLTLQLPAGRMDAIFADFTPQEKADAITAVLQARLN